MSSTETDDGLFKRAAITNNPAWVQLLGLCPLLAVSNSLANALALAFASALVLIGSNTLISALRHFIPGFARLPMFVLIIASFTTCATLILQAFAYPVYLEIALFVQIIVTNCMILGRAEAFAHRNGVVSALIDALGTAVGFAIALIALGIVRELMGSGTLGAGLPFTDGTALVTVTDTPLLIAALPPGAFVLAGLLLALANAGKRASRMRGGGQRATQPATPPSVNTQAKASE